MNVSARMLRRLLALVCLAVTVACANPVPGLPPPGFEGTAQQFFYPIALAVDASGNNLYVANSNFDRSFTSGSLVQIPTSLFVPPSGFDAGSSSGPAMIPLTSGDVLSSSIVDSFAGTMLLNTAGDRLYVTTRDHGTLSTAGLDTTTGALQCDTKNGCSLNAICLNVPPFLMTDPFAMKLASLPLPCDVTPPATCPTATPQNVIVVSHLSPATSGVNGVGRSAHIAVIPEPQGPPVVPTSNVTYAGGGGPCPSGQQNVTPAPKAEQPFSPVSYTVNVGPLGMDGLDVGPGNLIYAGGCFIRVTGETIVPCLLDTSAPQYLQNPLRFFYGNADANAEVQQVNLGVFFNGGQTQDIAISSDGTELYVATSTPNALVTIDLPVPGGNPIPTLRSTVVLANAPNRIMKLPRPPLAGVPQGDLVAVTAADPNVVLANTSAFLVVDPQAATLITYIQPIGLTPYGMIALPTPVGSTTNPTAANPTVTTGYRVFITLFTGCGVAEVDIPLAEPELAAHISTVGSCPP